MSCYSTVSIAFQAVDVVLIKHISHIYGGELSLSQIQLWLLTLWYKVSH